MPIPTEVQSTLLKILEVLIPILLGLGFRLLGVFGDREGDILREFVIRLPVPLLVFFSMYDADMADIAAMPAMMAGLVLLTAAMFVVGIPLTRLVKGAARRTALHACICFSNYGWMGFGVSQVLLGQDGLRRAVFFIILWWPVFYGFGLPIGLLHSRGKKGAVPMGRAVKLALPVISAMLVGLAFNLFHWELAGLLQRTLRPFGQMTVPLILFSVGVMINLKGLRRSLKPALLVSGVTLLLAPLVGWCLAALLRPDATARSIMVIEAAMPVATLTPLLAENFEMDMDLTTTAIVVSTLLSMLTLPLVAVLVL